MKKLFAVLIGTTMLGLAAPISAGWNYKALKGIDAVVVKYLNPDSMDRNLPVYAPGSTIMYRVTLYNFGHRPYRNFPITASLHYLENSVCGSGGVMAGDLLPGSSRSDLQLISMAGQDGIAYFDVSYTIPHSVCPGMMEVQLDGGRGNGPQDSLHARERFIIR